MKSDFLYLPEKTVSFKDFEAAVEQAKSQSSLFVKGDDLLNFYASILAAKELNTTIYACPATMDDQRIEKLKPSRDPSIGIFTSGTTGEPKVILHKWEAVESASRFIPQRLFNKTWMLTYAPSGYAGLQVFLAALKSKGSIYYAQGAFKDICHEMVKYGVEIVSATPTFWRMLIGAWPQGLKVPKLLQATLGGEIVDQPTLNLIDSFFHPQNLTHIYASTEAGSVIAVSDKFAGFPISALEKGLRIVEGELEVFTNEWIQTGDLVQEKEGRVYFLGRKDGRINIGGRKVCPEEVEQAVNSLDIVADCLVYEKASPIVGSLIAADVVMKENALFDPAEIKKALKTQLEEYKIPHIIRRVDQIAISSTGKKFRKT